MRRLVDMVDRCADWTEQDVVSQRDDLTQRSCGLWAAITERN
jgi:hypothetical protein